MNSNDIKKIKDLYGRKGTIFQEICQTYFKWTPLKFLVFIVLAGMIYTICLIIEHLPMAGPSFAFFGGIKGAQLLLEYSRKPSL